MNSAKLIRSHFSDKMRHESRRDVVRVLNATRGDRTEMLAPYPCKFCNGWHNGHDPIAPLRQYEPRCMACSK